MLLKNKFFNAATGILLVLVIIYLSIQIKPILNEMLNISSTIFFPLFISAILYYITRPFREFMEKHKIPRIISIILIFISIYLCISIIIIFIWPYVEQQIVALTQTSPKGTVVKLENKTIDILEYFNWKQASKEQLREGLIYYFNKIIVYFSENFLTTIKSITQIASYFIITPFLLFYFLKDDYKMRTYIKKVLPKNYRSTINTILEDIDDTLAGYISGQVLIALIVGVLIFIGYSIIGLSYPILLAFLAFVFNLIPFCGPFISTIPALILAFSISPYMAVKVVAVVMLVHLFDMNLISPRIVGKRLHIHPVTVIFLLITSLSAFGFLSIFFVTPLYAVLKIIIEDLYLKYVGQD